MTTSIVFLVALFVALLHCTVKADIYDGSTGRANAATDPLVDITADTTTEGGTSGSSGNGGGGGDDFGAFSPSFAFVNGTRIFRWSQSSPNIASSNAYSLGGYYGEPLSGILLGLDFDDQYITYVIGNTGRIYTLDSVISGGLTAVGALNCSDASGLIPLYGSTYYFSWDTSNNAIRVVNSTGYNWYWRRGSNAYDLLPGCVPWWRLNRPGTVYVNPTGVGFTNIYNDTTPGTAKEYIIDRNATGSLFLEYVYNPNFGNITTVLNTGLQANRPTPFTVAYVNSTNMGYLAIGNTLYTLNLSSGKTITSITVPLLNISINNIMVVPNNFPFTFFTTTTGVTTTAAASTVTTSFVVSALMTVALMML